MTVRLRGPHDPTKSSVSFLIVAGELAQALQLQIDGQTPDHELQRKVHELRQSLLEGLLSVLRSIASRGGGDRFKLDLAKDRNELGFILEYLIHYADLLKQQRYTTLETACKFCRSCQECC